MTKEQDLFWTGFAWSIIVNWVLFVLFLGAYTNSLNTKWEQEAISHNAAEYTKNFYDSIEFSWKTGLKDRIERFHDEYNLEQRLRLELSQGKSNE